MVIRFTQNYEVSAVGGSKFRKGQVVKNLSETSEQHFLSRAVAVAYTSKSKSKKPDKATKDAGAAATNK
ncbi:MAG: hypothetical protein ACE5EM_11635 [Sphingomonadales bacterium]